MADKLRSNSVMRKTVLGRVLTFTYSDNTQLVFDADKSPGTHEQAMMHGYTQRIADAAAIKKDGDKSAPLSEKKAAMQRVVDALYNNTWTVEREAGDTLLFQALVRVYRDTDETKLRELVDNWTSAEKNAVAADKKISAEILKIKGERAKAAGADTIAKPLFDALAKLKT